MKLALLTNMPSYHQVQLGAQLAELLGEDNFRLVFSHPTSASRGEMGWQDGYQASFILRMWESPQAKQQVLAWIDSADVVIQGRFPISLVRSRINSGKLTFAYQERFWKKPFSWTRAVLRLPKIWRNYWSVNKPNYHLLAAGAYVAADLAVFKCFSKRMWKFGYFIDHVYSGYSVHTQPLSILWCARFSPVKRAADALRIFRGLQEYHPTAKLLMVGDGEERSRAEESARSMSDAVHFLGWQSPKQVKNLMLKANVFLMTSGFGEGWAVVINEAMRAGCVVVANQEIGAAPWLIKHRHTGLLYDQSDIQRAAVELGSLSATEIQEMGKQAQQLHKTTWNSRVAAERLIKLSEVLLDGQDASTLFDKGPCSPA